MSVPDRHTIWSVFQGSSQFTLKTGRQLCGFFVIIGLLVILQYGAFAADDFRIEKDVPYLGPDREEKGDIYIPTKIAEGERCPAVVVIHGGGWRKGDKRSKREINIAETLATHGYVGFSINYMLVGDRPIWPKNLHDCKTAVRWLRKNADRLNIDPNSIGVIGGSAGGHLAAMVALTGPESGLDPSGPYPEYSCGVQAVVDLYGPADLTTFSIKGSPDLPMFSDTLKENPGLYRRASPYSHADKDDPPILIIHGTADKAVSFKQSQRFAEVLKKAGARHQLIIIDGAPHSFDLQPKQRDLRPLVLEFFERHLKGTNNSVVE